VVLGTRRYFFQKTVAAKVHFSGVQMHLFHIVTESPWPLYGSSAALCLTIGAVQFFHGFECYFYDFSLLEWGFMLVAFVAFLWWKDVIKESTYLGYHTSWVIKGLRLGMVLFIVSEVMFFFSFFWAFFHASLSPSVVLGSIWPPVGINVLNPLHLPLLNTFILLTSGVTVTVSHLSVLSLNPTWDTHPIYDYWSKHWPLIWSSRMPWEFRDDRWKVDEAEYEIIQWGELSLLGTLVLAFEFTSCQALEYYHALFYINDGIFGSTFYVATGFHGLHVIVGSIFLSVCLYRMYSQHFLLNHHVGFEMAIWYWHFVDVVWLILYVFIYCWSAGF
jgi:cytochrome c oxidase subunit 3